MITAIWSAFCNSCGNEYQPSQWLIKTAMINSLKSKGWEVFGDGVVCKKCKDDLKKWGKRK